MPDINLEVKDEKQFSTKTMTLYCTSPFIFVLEMKQSSGRSWCSWRAGGVKHQRGSSQVARVGDWGYNLTLLTPLVMVWTKASWIEARNRASFWKQREVKWGKHNVMTAALWTIPWSDVRASPEAERDCTVLTGNLLLLWEWWATGGTEGFWVDLSSWRRNAGTHWETAGGKTPPPGWQALPSCDHMKNILKFTSVPKCKLILTEYSTLQCWGHTEGVMLTGMGFTKVWAFSSLLCFRREEQINWHEKIYMEYWGKIAKKQLTPVRELRSFLWRTVEVCSLSLWKTEGWLTGRASRPDPWADSPAQEGADAGQDRRTPQCSIRKLWGSWGVGGPWRQPPGAETPAPCLPGQQRCEGWTPESVCFLPGWD